MDKKYSAEDKENFHLYSTMKVDLQGWRNFLIEHHAKQTEAKIAIDFGSGTGHKIKKLQNTCHAIQKYYGIDFSKMGIRFLNDYFSADNNVIGIQSDAIEWLKGMEFKEEALVLMFGFA